MRIDTSSRKRRRRCARCGVAAGCGQGVRGSDRRGGGRGLCAGAVAAAARAERPAGVRAAVPRGGLRVDPDRLDRAQPRLQHSARLHRSRRRAPAAGAGRADGTGAVLARARPPPLPVVQPDLQPRELHAQRARRLGRLASRRADNAGAGGGRPRRRRCRRVPRARRLEPSAAGGCAAPGTRPLVARDGPLFVEEPLDRSHARLRGRHASPASGSGIRTWWRSRLRPSC